MKEEMQMPSLLVPRSDSKGGKSEYTISNVFAIAIQLVLVQDGDIVKSYKDGTWKII